MGTRTWKQGGGAERAPLHRLVCTGCEAVVAFEDPQVEELRREVAREHGFEARKLQLYGKCPGCRAGADHPRGPLRDAARNRRVNRRVPARGGASPARRWR